MAVNFNPAIVNNGLVFAYDMGNTKKSWFGAPTTNLAKNSNETIDWSIGNLTGAVSRSTVTTNEVYRITSTTAGAFRFYFNLSKLVNGQAYTMSFRYRFISQNASQSFYLTDWNDTAIITTTTNLGDGIVYHTGTGSRATYDNTYRFMDGYISASTIVEIWDLQLEQSSIATPYTKYQRTSVESIQDLTKSTQLSVSDLLYLYDNTFEFDGNARITGNLVNSASALEYTRVVWVRPTASSGDMKSAFLNSIGNNSDMAIGIEAGFPAFHQYTNSNGQGTTGDFSIRGSTAITINNTYMIAATVDRNTTTNNIKVYLNGVLDGIGSRSLGTSNSNTIIVGGPSVDSYSGSRMFYGSIYSAFHYDRVLSDLEIMQNFSALRARFGV